MIGLVVSSWSHHGSAQDKTVYVPYVRAYTGFRDLPGHVRILDGWNTTISVFNSASEQGRLSVTAAYGDGVELITSPPCILSLMPPHTGFRVPSCASFSTDVFDRAELAFVEMKVSHGAVIGANVIRWREVLCCLELTCGGPVPQGQAALPVYRGLFPAGSTAVAGPVELGAFKIPDYCVSGNQVYRRRVNVTMLNAGDRAGVFLISEIPGTTVSTPVREQTVSVPAKGVVQVNSIPVPTEPGPGLASPSGAGYQIWFKVTADQPFLFYVSTIFDDPEPGALPFQVYPASLGE